VALVGLGGVGKSQLAIEHCYRILDQSPGTWVFWVHASNASRLEQGFQDIADNVRMRGRKDAQVNVFKLVSNWLHSNGPWHLVIDNADDDEVLSPLSGYLGSGHGTVLVTSRTKSAANQVVDSRDFISVGPMDPRTAHMLLLKDLSDKSESDNSIDELATELDFMPLALAQAAAYIRRARRCSVQQYLERYRQSDSSKTSLLNQEAGHLRRDGAASNSVLSTWQISFEYIKSKRPSAADLLSLMSFFDRQGIQEAFLRSRNRTTNDPMVDDRFEQDVRTLRDFSIIKPTSDTNTFEMHSLVQLATRKWLEHRGQINFWRKRFIARLRAVMPEKYHEDWKKCQALLPHAKAAFIQQPRGRKSLRDWGIILYQTTLYSFEMGRYDEAQRISTVCIEAHKEVFGEEDEETLRSIFLKGDIKTAAGQHEEAETIFRSILRRAGMACGAEHPLTLEIGGRLAAVLAEQGKYEEAEPMARRCLAQAEKIAPNDRSTLDAKNDMVWLLWVRGKDKKAEPLARQALAHSETVLGPEDPITLDSMSFLSLVLISRGKYEEAESIARHALALHKKSLGPGHVNTSQCMVGLGDALERQRRYKEAESMLREALALQEKLLGSEHGNTLYSVVRLAHLLAKQRRFGESQVLFERACAGYSEVYGNDHQQTRWCREEHSDMLASWEEYSRMLTWREENMNSRAATAGYALSREVDIGSAVEEDASRHSSKHPKEPDGVRRKSGRSFHKKSHRRGAGV
jgi:tetratricopeptide (TPR) repeat protein